MTRISVELLAKSKQYKNRNGMRVLNLRKNKIPVIENMAITEDQFDYIDMSDNDVTNLYKLPLLKRLQALYLHNNRVQFISPTLGESLPELSTLLLTNNNLCELGDVDGLATCEKLKYLTLLGNPIAHKPHYRLYVIFKVPQLRVLDFKKICPAEQEDAKKMFKGKKNAKFVEYSNAPNDAGDCTIMTEEDKQSIQEALKNAKEVVEIEYLQQILASGRILVKGWNRQMDQAEKTNEAKAVFALMNDATTSPTSATSGRPMEKEPLKLSPRKQGVITADSTAGGDGTTPSWEPSSGKKPVLSFPPQSAKDALIEKQIDSENKAYRELPPRRVPTKAELLSVPEKEGGGVKRKGGLNRGRGGKQGARRGDDSDEAEFEHMCGN